MQKCDSIIDPRHKHLLGRNFWKGEKTPSSTHSFFPSSRHHILLNNNNHQNPYSFPPRFNPERWLNGYQPMSFIHRTSCHVSGRRWLLFIWNPVLAYIQFLFYLFPASKMIYRWFSKSLIKSFINNPISRCLDRQRRVNFELDPLPFRIKLPNLLLLPYMYIVFNLFILKTTLQQNLPMESHYAFTRFTKRFIRITIPGDWIGCCVENQNLYFFGMMSHCLLKMYLVKHVKIK